MRTPFQIPVAAAAAACLISACAGGGGGNVGVGMPAPPPPAPVAIPSESVPSSTSSLGCPASSSDLGGLIACQAAAVYEHWQSCGCAFGNFSIGSPTVDDASFALPASNPLSYASWGPWGTGDNVMAAPTGTRTPPEVMPQTGTAEYAGHASGTFSYGHNQQVLGSSPLQGTATVHIDFSKGEVGAEINLPFYGAAFTGSLKGNTYSGTSVSNSSPTSQVDNTFSGAFFGPSASETAGSFSSKAMNLETLDFSTIQGTFGATKICPVGQPGC